MASKNAYLRKIHKRGNKLRGNAAIISSSTVYNQPNIPNIGAPEDLEVTDSGIQRSTQASLTYVTLAWLAPNTGQVNYYIVEYSTDSGFTSYQRQKADIDSAIIEGLKANTLYYFRVQAVSGSRFSDYSNTVSETTPTDNTAAPDVTGLSASFNNSNLVITWSKPISEIYKDAEIKIYNAAGSILYETIYSGAQTYVWRAEDNIAATGGSPVTSVFIRVKSRSWNNVLSTGVTTTASSTAPSTPVITSNWDGDTGVADEDFVLTWPTVSGADNYGLTIDGNAFTTKDNRFTYRYDTNVNQHVPTLKSGDPNLVAIVFARNKLNQQSSNATLSGNNAAPNVSTLSLATNTGFSQIAANVSLLSNTIIQDFSHYEWALISGGLTLSSFISSTPDVIFPINADGTYSVSVKAVDKFNQKSTALIASGIFIDTLTIAELRADAIYSDSVGNSANTLAILKDGSYGASVTYPATTWHWTKVERPLIDRYGIITLAASTLMEFYIGLSTDDITYTWYAGPLSSTGVMIQQGDQATAQTNAISMSDAFIVLNNRVEIPSIKEARYIKLYHRSVGSTHPLAEFYPRRLIESDDIRAESIKAINIAAAAVTADKISVINLQAVSANMGALHMDGVIDIVSGGGIYQGTGTFASPTTGLKLFNSSGVGKLSGYNSGVEQITIGTDGKLKAGIDQVILDATGLQVLVPAILIESSVTTKQKVLFKRDTDSVVIGQVYASWIDASTDIYTLYLNADGPASGADIAVMVGPRRNGGNVSPSIYIIDEISGTDTITVTATEIRLTASSDIFMSGSTTFFSNVTLSSANLFLNTLDATTNTLAESLILEHNSSATPAAGFGHAITLRGDSSTHAVRNMGQIYADWSVATDATRQGRLRLNANDSVGARTGVNIIANGSAVQLGFYGATPVSKQTVTGTRTGTLAQLQTVMLNLLTALSNEGLITDSTT
jgi:hypothetical protein